MHISSAATDNLLISVIAQKKSHQEQCLSFAEKVCSSALDNSVIG